MSQGDDIFEQVRRVADFFDLFDDEVLDLLGGNLRKVVEDINDKLEVADRALGHRVWQTIEAYIANHPDVIKAEASERNAAIRTAFEQLLENLRTSIRRSHSVRPPHQVRELDGRCMEWLGRQPGRQPSSNCNRCKPIRSSSKSTVHLELAGQRGQS